jgi:hypothetical protein
MSRPTRRRVGLMGTAMGHRLLSLGGRPRRGYVRISLAVHTDVGLPCVVVPRDP